MKFTGERMVPWEPVGWTLAHAHIMRYSWATRIAYGATVVDLGCGAGYGSFLLSWVAENVTGLDVSTEAVEYARVHFQAGNLAYWVMDLEMCAMPQADLYVAFEVLEHLEDPVGFVERVNAPLLWSLPVGNRTPFHKHVYSVREILDQFEGALGYQTAEGNITGAIPDEAKHGHILGFRNTGGVTK